MPRDPKPPYRRTAMLLPETPTGPCFWCKAPAPELYPAPADYQGTAYYACPPTDWAGCAERKRAVDAVKRRPPLRKQRASQSRKTLLGR